MTTPHIIRTREELEALDSDTVLYRTVGFGPIVSVLQARQISPRYDLPAVVIATGEQVRAARKALEDA